MAELATLEWVQWFNHKRLHSAIGLREGQRVEFEITQGEKGPQASNVRLVG